MTIDPTEIAALAAAAFAGSVVFGVTGFGAALVTVPFATHFVPLPFALALYVLMDLANAYRIGFENPKNAVKSEWTRMVPTILVGTVTGVTLLVNLPRGAATLALGVFVVAYAVYSLLRRPDARRADFAALGLDRRIRGRRHQHHLRRRRAALRDLPVAARPLQGAVPRHARPGDAYQHLDPHRGVLCNRQSA